MKAHSQKQRCLALLGRLLYSFGEEGLGFFVRSDLRTNNFYGLSYNSYQSSCQRRNTISYFATLILIR